MTPLHLPLQGVAVDAAHMPAAEAAWLSWRRQGWLEGRDLRIVGILSDDAAALALCLTQPVAWCRSLLLEPQVARVAVPALRRAVAHVEACGMVPSAGGGRQRDDGLKVRGPTRPTRIGPPECPDPQWVSWVVAWSRRLWWLRDADGVQVVRVNLRAGA